MESWSLDSGDKGFVFSNQTISALDFPNAKTKNILMGWELKDSSSCYDDHIMMVSSPEQPFENEGVLEVGFPGMKRKQSSDDCVTSVPSIGSAQSDVITTNTINSNMFSRDEWNSRLSNPVADSNSRESSLIDLQLGRFGDNLKLNATTRTTPVLSSAVSSMPAKRAKALSLNSQPAFCQVYGCNKDLSSSKDYHKRHKVCEVHSKTAKVIVNGLDQRFCQQCSRFHFLAEFDDGKRSCRKRLAGHNERRRKPQVGLHSGRAGRLLHSSSGSGGTSSNRTASTTSFICQDILPLNGALRSTFDWYRHIKHEDRPDVVASKPVSYCIDRHLPQKSVLPLLNKKQYSFLESANTTITSAFSESNINQYLSQDTGSLSMFQNNSLGSEDLTLFDTASTVEGLPVISESGCALSLLSSQTQNCTGPLSSGMSTTSHPLIIPDNISSHHHYTANQMAENLYGFSSQGLSNGLFSKHASHRVASSVGRNQMTPMPHGNGNTGTVGTDFAGGFLQGTHCDNVKDRLSFGGAPTINLLQLSTQLQRVEHQRQALSVKQEN